MLIAVEGTEADSHWTDTAREFLRGLLIYVAGLPVDRRTMAELRRIVTASTDDLADTLADMRADPERGHRIPARAAAAHLNRPERNAARCCPPLCAIPPGWTILGSVPSWRGQISTWPISSGSR